MTRFIALLAIASGLLLVESKADATKEHCVHPAKDFVELIESFSAQGFSIEALSEKETQAYMRIAREIVAIPELPGTIIVVVENAGHAAIAFIFRDDMRCGYIKVTWQLHQIAMKAAKGERL
jgi:hypothetical protein